MAKSLELGRGRGKQMDCDRVFTFEALRREFGVTSRTLRYYEEQGLLAPARVGQQRLYRAQDRTRLRLVLICRRAGVSIADARRLVAVRAPFDGEAKAGPRDLEALRSLIAKLTRRRSEICALISDLELWIGSTRVNAIQSRGSCSGPMRSAEPQGDRANRGQRDGERLTGRTDARRLK